MQCFSILILCVALVLKWSFLRTELAAKSNLFLQLNELYISPYIPGDKDNNFLEKSS